MLGVIFCQALRNNQPSLFQSSPSGPNSVATESLLEGQAEALTQTAIVQSVKRRYSSPAPIRSADKPWPPEQSVSEVVA